MSRKVPAKIRVCRSAWLQRHPDLQPTWFLLPVTATFFLAEREWGINKSPFSNWKESDCMWNSFADRSVAGWLQFIRMSHSQRAKDPQPGTGMVLTILRLPILFRPTQILHSSSAWYIVVSSRICSAAFLELRTFRTLLSRSWIESSGRRRGLKAWL